MSDPVKVNEVQQSGELVRRDGAIGGLGQVLIAAVNALRKRTGGILGHATPNPGYTVATLPDAATNEGATIYVSDEAGGATLAFSDGADWRRIQDRAVVS